MTNLNSLIVITLFLVLIQFSSSEIANSPSTATCSKVCQNGGTCVGTNICQCPENFGGLQCQYSVDRCSPQKIGFNGGFSCSGTQTGMQCSLTCPPEIDFEYQPKAFYSCDFATGKFTPERMPKCVYGESFNMIQRSQVETIPDKAPSRGPTCNPRCQNGGVCFFNDICECPKNFAGPQCQYSIDRCAPKNLGFNGGVRCAGTQTGMSCILKNCPPGLDFSFAPAETYKCEYAIGRFTPERVPKCEAFCNPECQNGGTCVFANICQCPKDFRGPQCQFSVDRCSIENTGFNGGFKCSGSSTEMICSLQCPSGIDYEFPPANQYTCKYETGRFTPSPVPKCVFGEGDIVVGSEYSSHSQRFYNKK